MMNLAEYRHSNARLADFLPWAALVDDGIILNKDGSFQRTARFRGPDLDSAVPAELVAVTGRLNNALRRLGSGWAVFVEAQRHSAGTYPNAQIFAFDFGGSIRAAAYRSGGLAGVAEASASAAMSPLRRAAAALGSAGQAGAQAVSTSAEGQPDWARRMKGGQTIRHGASAASHAVRSGDHGGSGSSVDLSEGER